MMVLNPSVFNDEAFKGITITHESPLRELSLRENKEVDSSWTELFNALCTCFESELVFAQTPNFCVHTHTQTNHSTPAAHARGNNVHYIYGSYFTILKHDGVNTLRVVFPHSL